MKRLILCCDGTWNTADQQHNGDPCPTNVVKMACRVAKRDGDTAQIIYYDQGVGTGNLVDRVSGGALGRGLEDNIHDAYRFLVANYEPGDELYLLGFSRGAFTARSVVGMIRKCGILSRCHVDKYSPALKLYRDDTVHPDDPRAVSFRTSTSILQNIDIPVRFIGVWDTVGSLGIPLRGLRYLTRTKYQFHDTELSGTVERAYHALAIDEHRAPFEPALWTYKPKPNQIVEQVWFCGAHSDVGGGYPESDLSDVSLDWMIKKALVAGLRFDSTAMATFSLNPNPLAEMHNSKTGMYRLTVGIDRTIGTDPTQSLHQSVLERWDKTSYRPKSVRDFFKAQNDPRWQMQ
jgi:uncharacterized protein (DUF2235 family)